MLYCMIFLGQKEALTLVYRNRSRRLVFCVIIQYGKYWIPPIITFPWICLRIAWYTLWNSRYIRLFRNESRGYLCADKARWVSTQKLCSNQWISMICMDGIPFLRGIFLYISSEKYCTSWSISWICQFCCILSRCPFMSDTTVCLNQKNVYYCCHISTRGDMNIF